MTYLDYQYHQFIILDLAQQSIIADAIPPEVGQIALQGFATGARVVCGLDALLQKGNDALLYRLVQFLQVPLGVVR